MKTIDCFQCVSEIYTFMQAPSLDDAFSCCFINITKNILWLKFISLHCDVYLTFLLQIPNTLVWFQNSVLALKHFKLTCSNKSYTFSMNQKFFEDHVSRNIIPVPENAFEHDKFILIRKPTYLFPSLRRKIFRAVASIFFLVNFFCTQKVSRKRVPKFFVMSSHF